MLPNTEQLTLTDREILLLTAAALQEAAALYPDSIVRRAYSTVATIVDERIGEWTNDEFTAAQKKAANLSD